MHRGPSHRERGPTKLNVNNTMKRASKMMVPVGYIILHMKSEISHDIMELLAHSVKWLYMHTYKALRWTLLFSHGGSTTIKLKPSSETPTKQIQTNFINLHWKIVACKIENLNRAKFKQRVKNQTIIWRKVKRQKIIQHLNLYPMQDFIERAWENNYLKQADAPQRYLTVTYNHTMRMQTPDWSRFDE